MKQTPVDPYASHDEVVLLLPWHVNHTLKDRELNMVQNHLKICLVCRREFEYLQKLALTVLRDRSSDASAHVSFAHLLSRIDQAGGSGRTAINENPAEARKVPGKFSAALISAAGAALAAVLAGFMLMPDADVALRPVNQDYRTLSDSGADSLAKNEVKAVFAEAAAEKIDALVKAAGGEIVSGPDRRGVYVIRLGKPADDRDIAGALDLLRRRPEVLFAEPSAALLDSVSAQSVDK